MIVLVRRVVDFLLECRHEPHPGDDSRGDFRILQLEEETVLPCERIARLSDFITGSADLDHVAPHGDPHVHAQQGGVLRPTFFLLARGAAGEVGLVLAALGVGEVGAIILVHRQAEAAFEGADVVFEEVGVFFEVDGLESKLAEPFAAVGVGAGK